MTFKSFKLNFNFKWNVNLFYYFYYLPWIVAITLQRIFQRWISWFNILWKMKWIKNKLYFWIWKFFDFSTNPLLYFWLFTTKIISKHKLFLNKINNLIVKDESKNTVRLKNIYLFLILNLNAKISCLKQKIGGENLFFWIPLGAQ